MKALNENLSYEFKPAGHNLKIERRDYIKTESKLYEVFEKWLDEFNVDTKFWLKNYYKAVDILKDIKPTIDEAHSALIAYQDHPKIEYAGLFLSAVYNLVPDKVIVFDVDLDVYIDYLGYRLENGKTLVNRSKVGDSMGRNASGMVINYGRAGLCMGCYASGMVINYGEAGTWMGDSASGIVVNYGKAKDEMGSWSSGVVINYGEVRKEMGSSSSGIVINYGKAGYKMGDDSSGVVINYGEAGNRMGSWSSGIVVNYGKAGDCMGDESSGKIIAIKNPKSFCGLDHAELVLNEEECRRIPGLIEYFDELKNKIYEARNNPEFLLKVFSDNPADKIKKDVDNIVEISIIIFPILSILSKIRRFFKLL